MKCLGRPIIFDGIYSLIHDISIMAQTNRSLSLVEVAQACAKNLRSTLHNTFCRQCRVGTQRMAHSCISICGGTEEWYAQRHPHRGVDLAMAPAMSASPALFCGLGADPNLPCAIPKPDGCHAEGRMPRSRSGGQNDSCRFIGRMDASLRIPRRHTSNKLRH